MLTVGVVRREERGIRGVELTATGARNPSPTGGHAPEPNDALGNWATGRSSVWFSQKGTDMQVSEP
jgi:hypothetical protein